MEIDLKGLKIKAQKDIKKAQNLKELDEIFKKYLGKKGELSLVLRSLKEIPPKKRVKIGKEANDLKKFLSAEIKRRASVLKTRFPGLPKGIRSIDVTVPGKKSAIGHLHPLTSVKRKIMEIFQQLGFDIVNGPELETEWYNFDALNIPKDHPARDAWNTLWLKPQSQISNFKSQRLLLRTHTSPVQARYMERHNPPLRIIVPGKVFRYEATDPSHEFQFYQFEGLMVDKDINVSHLKAVVKEFFKGFFKRNIEVKFRPDYFPFTEPSFEIAMACLACEGKGLVLSERSESKECSVCESTGWLEMAGAGMVHPNVFKTVGYKPGEWQGWAFGFGWDRLTMMKYKIPDIRLFSSGDLRLLQQF